MAEQLRYEQQFKGLDIPNVDFAAEREISKGYAQMSAKLDQMSNFFMKQAEGMAKIEGAEYGAANAPTKQQIEDAKAKGEEVEVPGDKYSVYGRAARAASLEALYDDVTYTAKRKILSDLTSYEKQNLDPSLLQDQFDEMIQGYAATFDETSPALAKKFRAEMGIYAYSKVSTETSSFLKIQKEEKKARYAAATELFLNNKGPGGLRTLIFGAVDSMETDPEGNPTGEVEYRSVQQIDAEIIEQKKKMVMGALEYGFTSTQLKTLTDAFDARVLEIKSNIILEEMYTGGSAKAGTFYKRLKIALEKGENSEAAKQLPPSVRNALFSGTSDEARAILGNVRQGYHTILDDKTKEISYNDTVRNDTVASAERDFNKGLVQYHNPTGATAEEKEANRAAGFTLMSTALGVLKKNSPGEKYTTYNDTFEFATQVNIVDGKAQGFAPSNHKQTEMNFEMDMMRVNPFFTMADVNLALKEKRITFDYYKTLLGKYNALYDAEMTEAIKAAKIRVGVPGDTMLSASFLGTQEQRILSSVISGLTFAKEQDTDGTFNPMSWLDENLPNLVNQVHGGQAGAGATGNNQVANEEKLITRSLQFGGKRKNLVKLIEKMSDPDGSDYNPERADVLEGYLEEIDALFNSQGFNKQRMPNWNN